MFKYSVLTRLDSIAASIADLTMRVINLEKHMSAELDRIEASVEQLKTVEASAVALLGSLAQLIRDSVNDPARLTKLANDLDATKVDLAAAVAANTPTPPAPPA